jgi:YidC/Oxa1 family membrane protein insertase
MDNRRLLLLLVFSFSLVMLWDAWQKYSQPKAVCFNHGQHGRNARTTAFLNLHAPLPVAPVTAAVASAEQAETVIVKTDLLSRRDCEAGW